LSFTIDAWTSKNTLPFLGITVHWISNEWILCSSTLDFSLLPGSHSGENLAKKFIEILSDFNIKTKVFFIFLFLFFILFFIYLFYIKIIIYYLIIDFSNNL
jgi:hypothetical protein